MPVALPVVDIVRVDDDETVRVTVADAVRVTETVLVAVIVAVRDAVRLPVGVLVGVVDGFTGASQHAN